ncbi:MULTISPECIES: phosphoribosyl-ATP diphosphatase [Leptospira]|uniref:Phosphoribosyl-ATP pyrophosphatase n=6 Tax=Leptospira TaxID=171 RepID=M3EP95_9LEPT|nr:MULTISPECIES: phosphoribosyl-ATP diphosphatase [Leptospira]EMF82873.1 phosphoribosyl-ATP diphosphatase [Leptospira weilii serovar Topaz str. LT2116]EMM72132.1 phosphoribosyl-ATP diphosphatase [Leptospira weilii str. 2006001855]EMY12990.1 phosphoribosyl-ATP diphosphatase [Leptospira weilii str. Ecochallenge]EKR65659.1 phosphoribosyl-ATP diphosphatase [Leptospira weilii str. 2006001853]EMJ59738.1 phosphoribosyl-ATP diphosphatase [Leptospira sp. P2653]
MEFLLQLENILKKRKQDLPDKSYTADLFRGGVDRILKKVGEEAGEVIIAAKNSDKKELTHEAADLLFHLQVLLVEQELSLQDIVEELRKRHS